MEQERTHMENSETSAFFKNGMDHLIEEMQPIRQMLESRVQWMTKRFESEIQSHLRPYGITPTEAMEHIRRAENEAQPAAFKKFTQSKDLDQRINTSLENGVFLPLVQLRQLFRLNPIEKIILLTCLLPEFYIGFHRVFGFLQDDATLSYPTPGFIMELFCDTFAEREKIWQAFHVGSVLRSWRIIVPIGDETRIPPLQRAYRVDERITTYLQGSQRYDGDLEDIMILQDPAYMSPPESQKNIIDTLVSSVKEGRECNLVHLAGDEKDVNTCFVNAVTSQLKWRLLKVPISGLRLQKEWSIQRVNLLLREAVLQPAVILIFDDASAPDPVQEMGPFLRILAKKGMILFYHGKHSITDVYLEPSIHYIKLEFNTQRASERLRYWQQAIENNGLNWSDDVAEQLAMRYPLSGQEVDNMFLRLHYRLNGERQHTHQALNIFKQVINDYTRRPLDELAQRIDPKVDWLDLVVHKSLADHLKAFRNTIAHQFTVYEKWGMGDKDARGRGVVAMFSGGSGTGKTMAAEVIANDMGINLYRVDLAGIVSKYIGETEKNLKKIFQNARGTNTLLFFDEADSLFGKRTDIHDSHDRYANLEVNYLLQKLEEHDGPVILATNRRKNIDEAFLRRIHFILEFPNPSESLRKIIWQKKLAASVPKADDIDFIALAKQFEISGGDIKNAALQAAFMAAENKTPVCMEYILGALKREYLKLGKHFPGSLINQNDTGLFETPEARRRKKEVRRLGS